MTPSSSRWPSNSTNCDRIGDSNRRPLTEIVGQVLVEQQRQAFGRAACLDEFGKRCRHHLVPPRAERLAQGTCGVAGDERVAEPNRVAGETEGVLVADLDPPLRRDERFDPQPRRLVERRRVVDHPTVGQRYEAGIDVVEALVDEPQRNHGNP